MNILLIIFNSDIESPDVFKDRIKALGETFYISDNIVFVETDSSTQEAYNKISSNEYEQSSMLILYVHNKMLGFWGRMNTQLWDWLGEKEERTKDSLTSNYVSEIFKLSEDKEELEWELKRIKSDLEDSQKTIENLYVQNRLLEAKIKKEGII